MSVRLTFHPADDLGGVGKVVSSGGGGFPVTATVAPDVVWIGGTSNIACADPTTGRILASDSMPSAHQAAANVSAIVSVGRRLFGYYLSDDQSSPLLIRLIPPAPCRR